MENLKIVECDTLPNEPEEHTVYVLKAVDRGIDYYLERTNRNIGWISKEEQLMLKSMTVAVGGCGGMGSPIVERSLRCGLGTVKVCDIETYDVSNINRQIPANQQTIGVNKAFATARMLRNITDDCTLIVYPMGVAPEMIEHFVSGSDVIIDEIEFFINSRRMLLHREARKQGIYSFMGNTVGMSTNVFQFSPGGMTVEEYMGVSYEEMAEKEARMAQGLMARQEKEKLIEMFIKCFIPVIPEYYEGNYEICFRRLVEEGKAPILTTNPPMSVGILGDRMLLHLLRKSGLDRSRHTKPLPEIPGYFHFDAAKLHLEAKYPD